MTLNAKEKLPADGPRLGDILGSAMVCIPTYGSGSSNAPVPNPSLHPVFSHFLTAVRSKTSCVILTTINRFFPFPDTILAKLDAASPELLS